MGGLATVEEKLRFLVVTKLKEKLEGLSKEKTRVVCPCSRCSDSYIISLLTMLQLFPIRKTRFNGVWLAARYCVSILKVIYMSNDACNACITCSFLQEKLLGRNMLLRSDELFHPISEVLQTGMKLRDEKTNVQLAVGTLELCCLVALVHLW